MLRAPADATIDSNDVSATFHAVDKDEANCSVEISDEVVQEAGAAERTNVVKISCRAMSAGWYELEIRIAGMPLPAGPRKIHVFGPSVSRILALFELKRPSAP